MDGLKASTKGPLCGTIGGGENQPQRTQRNAEENLSEEQEVVSLLRMFDLLMQPMLVTGPKCLTSNLKGAGD